MKFKVYLFKLYLLCHNSVLTFTKGTDAYAVTVEVIILQYNEKIADEISYFSKKNLV